MYGGGRQLSTAELRDLLRQLAPDGADETSAAASAAVDADGAGAADDARGGARLPLPAAMRPAELGEVRARARARARSRSLADGA